MLEVEVKIVLEIIRGTRVIATMTEAIESKELVAIMPMKETVVDLDRINTLTHTPMIGVGKKRANEAVLVDMEEETSQGDVMLREIPIFRRNGANLIMDLIIAPPSKVLKVVEGVEAEAVITTEMVGLRVEKISL